MTLVFYIFYSAIAYGETTCHEYIL